MIRLAQPFWRNTPLIRSQGNIGSISDPSQFAAQRYVELGIANVTKDLFFKDLTKVIPVIPNYDNSKMMPKHLPATFPSILSLGTAGIASGFSSEIVPHKIDDICNLTRRYIKQLKKGKITEKTMVEKVIKDFRPDFPMGGSITNSAQLINCYMNGTGSIVNEATIQISEYKGNQVLVVTDLPYHITTSRVLETLKSLINGKERPIFNDNITNIQDLSSKDQAVNLVISLKKGCQPEAVRQALYKFTPLRSTVKWLPNVIIGNTLVEFATLEQIIVGWLNFRQKILKLNFNNDLSEKTLRTQLLKALLIAFANLDEVIKITRNCKSKEDAIDKLLTKLNLSRKQSEYIANLKIYELSKVNSIATQDKIATLEEEINGIVALISDESLLLDYISVELEDIATKYKSERRTSLTNSTSNDAEFDPRTVSESYDLTIGLSEDNYLFAKKSSELKESNRGIKGSNFLDKKYKRIIKKLFSCNSHDDLIVFNEDGKFVKAKGYQLELWNKPISNVIPLSGNVISIINSNEGKLATLITKSSIMKHVHVKELVDIRSNSNGNIAILVENDDKLVDVVVCNKGDRILITSSNGRVQNLGFEDVAQQTRTSRGFPKASLEEDEEIVNIAVCNKDNIANSCIVVISNAGMIARTKITDIPERRGNSGKRGLLKLLSLPEGSRALGGFTVLEGDSVTCTTSSNKTQKFDTSSVRLTQRNVKGVKAATLGEGETIVSFSVG